MNSGSPVANWTYENIGQTLRMERLLKSLNVPTEVVAVLFLSCLPISFSLNSQNLLFVVYKKAFVNVTTEFMEKEFNPNVPDHPNVKYSSFTAVKDRENVHPLFRYFHDIISQQEGPNDILVR